MFTYDIRDFPDHNNYNLPRYELETLRDLRIVQRTPFGEIWEFFFGSKDRDFVIFVQHS